MDNALIRHKPEKWTECKEICFERLESSNVKMLCLKNPERRVSMCEEEPASQEPGKGRSERATPRMLLWEVREEDTEV